MQNRGDMVYYKYWKRLKGVRPMNEQELLLALRTIVKEELGPVNTRLDGLDQRMGGMDQRLDKVDQRLDGMDQRLDGMDQRLDKVDQRLDGMDRRLDGLDQRMSRVENTLEEIKEDAAITREATNTLLGWAEQAQVEVRIPLYKKAE